MSQPQEDGLDLAVEQRDLPPGLHLKVLLGAAAVLALAALAAMRYFL